MFEKYLCKKHNNPLCFNGDKQDSRRCFKIPLTNILGGIGMGYYSTAYSLYTPVFAMTAAAVPTVIIKAVADNIALRRFANAQRC